MKVTKTYLTSGCERAGTESSAFNIINSYSIIENIYSFTPSEISELVLYKNVQQDLP
jgi:hypothetical protein